MRPCTHTRFAHLAFSAYWWARFASFLIRALHLLLWLRHALFAYVDDFLLKQPASVAALGASLMLAFVQSFGIPLSWGKLQFGARVAWIGWTFEMRSHSFTLPAAKIQKLAHAIRAVTSGTFFHVKDVQRLVGLMQWVTQLQRTKPWLSSLYEDLNRNVATSFSIDTSSWGELISCLSEAAVFTRVPPGTAERETRECETYYHQPKK